VKNAATTPSSLEATFASGAITLESIDMYRDPRLEFEEPIDSSISLTSAASTRERTEGKNMETETDKTAPQPTLINWSDFEVKNPEDRIKVETGVKYELGFYSLRQSSIEVVDTERTEEGKVEVKKVVPTIILNVDFFNGKPAKKELQITSKKLIAVVKTYFEKDMLFKRVFQLEKSGEKYQTTYQLIALNDKPKA
jgi:hypothetical protein